MTTACEQQLHASSDRSDLPITQFNILLKFKCLQQRGRVCFHDDLIWLPRITACCTAMASQ